MYLNRHRTHALVPIITRAGERQARCSALLSGVGGCGTLTPPSAWLVVLAFCTNEMIDD